MNILVSIVVIAGLLAGGGATVKASQNDLPGEPLYAVKTFSENVSLEFQNSPEAKVERLLELAQTRVQEMSRMVEAGQTPPDQIRQRLEQHLQQAFQVCSNMDDASLDPVLQQVRDQLQQQERDMEHLQTHAGQAGQPILERTRIMLQERLQLANDGLQNHEMFRDAIRNGFHYGPTHIPPTSAPSTPAAPNGQQNGQATSQNGPGPNGPQNGQSTPQAGPNNGNGPGPNASVTPMQNQNQNQNQYQNQNKNGSGNIAGGHRDEQPGRLSRPYREWIVRSCSHIDFCRGRIGRYICRCEIIPTNLLVKIAKDVCVVRHRAGVLPALR